MLKKICKAITIIAGASIVSVVISRIIEASKSEDKDDDGEKPLKGISL
jgi:hypothetical protein